MKIVFLDSRTLGDDVSFAPIEKFGELIKYPTTSPEEVIDRIKDADVVISNKVYLGRKEFDAAKNLKLVCVAATGMNNIDLNYAASVKVPVKNAVNYSTESVAQLTFMQILNLVGKSVAFDDYCKSGKYSASGLFTNVDIPYFELKGKKLGIVGLGNIGSRVAEIASVFGIEVVYYPTSGKPHSDRYEALPLDELLSQCDIISIHAPLNDRTLNLIGYRELEMMKPSAFILNMGRGGIVNEGELAKALDEGIIAGAAADVFTKEPFPADHPFMTMSHKEKLLMTPHIAWASEQARVVLIDKIAENIASLGSY